MRWLDLALLPVLVAGFVVAAAPHVRAGDDGSDFAPAIEAEDGQSGLSPDAGPAREALPVPDNGGQVEADMGELAGDDAGADDPWGKPVDTMGETLADWPEFDAEAYNRRIDEERARERMERLAKRNRTMTPPALPDVETKPARYTGIYHAEGARLTMMPPPGMCFLDGSQPFGASELGALREELRPTGTLLAGFYDCAEAELMRRGLLQQLDTAAWAVWDHPRVAVALEGLARHDFVDYARDHINEMADAMQAGAPLFAGGDVATRFGGLAFVTPDMIAFNQFFDVPTEGGLTEPMMMAQGHMLLRERPVRLIILKSGDSEEALNAMNRRLRDGMEFLRHQNRTARRGS